MTKEPARLRYALCLRCPHCGQTPLLKSGSWLTFQTGCQPCAYDFEREEGYFTGALWVINYLVAGVTAAGLAVLLLWQAASLPLMAILAITSAVGIGVAIGFFPVAKALWLWLDHVLHPLTDN